MEVPYVWGRTLWLRKEFSLFVWNPLETIPIPYFHLSNHQYISLIYKPAKIEKLFLDHYLQTVPIKFEPLP